MVLGRCLMLGYLDPEGLVWPPNLESLSGLLSNSWEKSVNFLGLMVI